MTVLGGSGGVVNPLAFDPASLKSLACFYFRCTFYKMEGGYSEFAKFTVPILKYFLNARNQNVSGSKQRLIARAIGCPKSIISTKSRFSGQPKHDAVKTLFSDPPSPSPCNS